VFLALLQKNTSLVRSALCDNPQLFSRMLPLIHESPVGDALVVSCCLMRVLQLFDNAITVLHPYRVCMGAFNQASIQCSQ
jgi:hypothetical protein